MNVNYFLISVQGDGADGDGGQGGARETAPTAGTDQSCHQGNSIQLAHRPRQHSSWSLSSVVLVFKNNAKEYEGIQQAE